MEKPSKPEKPEKPAKPEKPKPMKPSSLKSRSSDIGPEFPQRPNDTESEPSFPKRPSQPVGQAEVIASLQQVHLTSVKSSSPPVKPPKPKAKPPVPKKITTPTQTPVIDTVAPVAVHSTVSPSPPPPPPVRNYKRVAMELPKTVNPETYDLELQTGWFTNTPNFHLPKSFDGLNYSCSYQQSYSGNSSSEERLVKVRLPDLSIVSFNILWKNGDISNAVSEVKTLLPSPLYSQPGPLKIDLIAAHEKFGEYVAAWCEHNFDKKVSTGECWDLAQQGLLKGCGKHAFVSEYYHHGFPILHLKDGKVIGDTLDEIKRGDILQFTNCTFFDPNSGVTQTVGLPNHTSVVVNNQGDTLLVLEQNVNNIKKVVNGSYNLRNLKSGEVTAYRPMPTAWAGTL